MSANKTLAAATLGGDVARAAVDVAGQRPNPELTIESERETPHEAYTLALPIETARKRQRRVDLSEAGARTGQAELARLTAETRVAVRRAFYALSAAQRRVEEMEEVTHVAERTRDAAKGRFEAGDVPRLDVLQAELSFMQSSNDRDAANAALGSARVGLNTLLARAPEEPIQVVGGLDTGQVPTTESALDVAMSASADLAVLDRRISEEQARIKLARAERVPDVTLAGTLTRRSPPEFDTGWRAGLTISLPLINQHKGEVRIEERTLTQLQAEREALVAQIRGSVGAALVLAAGQREQYGRYRDQMLPQAAEVEQMAAESYRLGQTGLVTMLQSLAMVREIRLKSVAAGLDFQIALADLELAIGAPLP